MEREKVTKRDVVELVGRMVMPVIDDLSVTLNMGDEIILRGELVGASDAECVGVHVSAVTERGRGDVVEVYIFKVDDRGQQLSPHETCWGYRVEAVVDGNPGDKSVSRIVATMKAVGELGGVSVDVKKVVVEALRKRLAERLKSMLNLLRNSSLTDNWFESQTSATEIYEIIRTRQLVGVRH